MIFTTWNFGRVEPPVSWMDKGFSCQAELGLAAARQYASDIFNICSAKRDYAYADHPWPAIPWPLHWCAAVEIKHNVIREFNRSNPNHSEINPN